jgi:hypothetical protein
MINTVRAAWQIVRKRENVFERTAKFGIKRREQDWTEKRYQLRFDPIVYPELMLGMYSLFTVPLAIMVGSYGVALYAFMFAMGLIGVAVVTIWQATAVYRRRKQRAKRMQVENKWASSQDLQKLGKTLNV